MPRQRKPQNGGQRFGTGRVANTTTGSTTTQAVYRIPTGNRRECDVRNFEVTWVSPIVVQIEWENIYRVSLDSDALKPVIEWYDILDLSNTSVTFNTVNWPITLTWNLDIQSGTLTVSEATITTLNSTTWTIATLTSTNATITNVSATDVSTWTLEASSNATIGWTLWVTGNVTLDADLGVGGNETVTWNSSVSGNSTISWNETITWTLGVTWATTVTDLTASSSITTVDLTATWTTAVAWLTAWTSTVDSLAVTNGATVWTTLWVTWNTTLWGDLSVAGNSTFTGTSSFTGDVSTGNISSTWIASLNDVAVAWNETVAWTLSVTWNTTLNSALTVAWATTMSSNAAIGGNLSVSWNSTVTGTSTTTWNAIFNSDVTVGGNETVSGNETITWTLTVGDDVILADDLTVNWSTSLKSLETDGSVDIDGTLRTSWAAVIGNGINVTWQVESDTVRTWEVVADEVRVTDWLYLSAWWEAPDFVLQAEKWEPNGVCPLDVNGKVDPRYLPPVYTTAIVKMGTWVFSNSNTAVVVDADITADSAVICTNYSDIVGDLNEVINIGQLTVVSNQVETGSFKYLIINPIE